MKARELGIAIGRGRPGRYNAITDVPGVRVGHTTLIRGEGPLVVGEGPVRTGVTVIIPHDGDVWTEPLFAGCHRLNGNGELTGLEWMRESGLLTSPIGLTNTHSVGVVRDALIGQEARGRPAHELFWGLPVVGETWDGRLNDVNGQHVKPEHVDAAVRSASSGPVAEGNVGSGTGMVCHGFKGGVGTASRVLDQASGGYVVGVLVQANHGRRPRLQINGVRVGEAIPESEVPVPAEGTAVASQGAGSIIGVAATNAPLLSTQCTRVAQRIGLGVARIGGVGEHWSGDIFLAFSTANRGMPASDIEEETPLTFQVTMMSNTYINAIFDAVVEATEEAIVNALLAADTMRGRDGITAYRLDPQRLLELPGIRA